MSNKPKVTIGILSFHDKRYLQKGLPSVVNQSYTEIEILVCDNNEDLDEKIKKWLHTDFPEIKVHNAGGNVGFGRGHNHLISKAKGEYYLAFNSDMFADKDYVKNLVEFMETHEDVGCATGKLLQWKNFPQMPDQIISNTIDTAGVIATASHYFYERGHGEVDNGQFDEVKELWGCSGAAPMLRIKALKEIDQSKCEYFDANFFMYKEDIDLMYRLRWAGWRVMYVPTALAWHDRTAAEPGGIIENIKKRKNRSAYIKENSFLNHLQFLYKNWSPDYGIFVKLKTGLFLAKYFLYLAFFDFQILKQYKKFKTLKPHLKKLREKMPRKISAKQMQNWFN